jgi:hypothetical protein
VIPRSRILIVNNGLALIEQAADLVHLVIGCSTDGPLNTPRTVGYSALCDTFGGGPAVKAAAYVAARNEANVIFVRIPATARAASFETRLGEWTGGTGITPTGTPTTGCLLKIKVIVAGTVGTTGASYQVSTDGGLTYGATTTLLTNLTIVANGVTVTFTTGQAFEGTLAILCLPASATVYGTTVTKDGSSGKMAFSGTPIDQYEIRAEIIKGGTTGTEGITLRYTLDGGRRWTEALRLGTANTFVLVDYTKPNGTEVSSGVTLTLQATSTYKAGDNIVARTTPPEPQPSDVVAALDAIEADDAFAGKFSFVHAVGHLGRRADVIALQARATSLVAEDTFTGILTAGRDRAPGEPMTEYAAAEATVAETNSADRVFVSGGYARITDPCGGWSMRRPVAFRVAERLVARPIPEALHDWSLGDVDDLDIRDENGTIVEYDGRKSSVLHDARYIVLTTRKRRKGLYFAGSPTMAPPGNDFKIIPYRRIFDIACGVLQVVGEDLLGLGIATNKTTGLLDEAAAQSFDLILTEAVNEAISVGGSGVARGAVLVQCKVSRTAPIIGPNGKLVAECRIIPISYIGGFEATISLVRKLATPAAA